MTDTVEKTEENITEPVKPVKPVQEVFDPREWARKTSGAYRYDTMVDNTHMTHVNRPKVIPVKESFECNSQYINNIDGTFDVKATKDINGGGLIEECHYWILESRLNDFIKGTKDKIGVRLLWTVPCDENTHGCEEFGPHIIIPRGNAMSYRPAESPNAYFEFDEVPEPFVSLPSDLLQREKVLQFLCLHQKQLDLLGFRQKNSRIYLVLFCPLPVLLNQAVVVVVRRRQRKESSSVIGVRKLREFLCK